MGDEQVEWARSKRSVASSIISGVDCSDKGSPPHPPPPPLAAVDRGNFEAVPEREKRLTPNEYLFDRIRCCGVAVVVAPVAAAVVVPIVIIGAGLAYIFVPLCPPPPSC